MIIDKTKHPREKELKNQALYLPPLRFRHVSDDPPLLLLEENREKL